MDRKAPDVSVIMPVHDDAPYLQCCLDGIFAQTYASFELICIDDGSRDESPALLERAARTQPHMRVITQDARGVSAARNAGLAAARGTYIAFVDADDCPAPTMLERTVARAREHDLDMLVFGYWKWFAASATLIDGPENNDETLYASPFSLAERTDLRFELSTANVWRMLFKRAFLEREGLRFCERLRYSEDAAFIWQAESVADRILLAHERLYRYRCDGRGAVSRAYRHCDMLHALDCVQEFLHERSLGGQAATMRLTNSAISQLRHGLRTATSAAEFDEIACCFERDWRDFVDAHVQLASERNARDYAAYMRCSRPEDYLFELYARHRQALQDTQVASERKRERAEQRQKRELAKLQREREAERAEATKRAAALEAENATLARALADARAENSRLRASRTFRLGAALLAAPRALKARLCKRRESN